MYATCAHTHTHFYHPSYTTTAINLSTHLLVNFSEWKCGIDKAHVKINIYTGKYIYECMCTSSTRVTKEPFALMTKAKTPERPERSLKKKQKTNIYNLSGCAHRQTLQPSDETWSTFTWKHKQLLCFPLQVSVLLVSSSIVHIPKTKTLKPNS